MFLYLTEFLSFSSKSGYPFIRGFLLFALFLGLSLFRERSPLFGSSPLAGALRGLFFFALKKRAASLFFVVVLLTLALLFLSKRVSLSLPLREM